VQTMPMRSVREGLERKEGGGKREVWETAITAAAATEAKTTNPKDKKKITPAAKELTNKQHTKIKYSREHGIRQTMRFCLLKKKKKDTTKDEEEEEKTAVPHFSAAWRRKLGNTEGHNQRQMHVGSRAPKSKSLPSLPIKLHKRKVRPMKNKHTHTHTRADTRKKANRR
jgi:hypothetical protein